MCREVRVLGNICLLCGYEAMVTLGNQCKHGVGCACLDHVPYGSRAGYTSTEVYLPLMQLDKNDEINCSINFMPPSNSSLATLCVPYFILQQLFVIH